MSNKTTPRLSLPVLILSCLHAHAAPAAMDSASLLPGRTVLIIDGSPSADAEPRAAAADVIKQLAARARFSVIEGDSAAVSESVLKQADIVVFNFLRDPGTALNPVQQAAFHDWLASGRRGVIAYGSSLKVRKGEWDWYCDSVTSMIYTPGSPAVVQARIDKSKSTAAEEPRVLAGLPDSVTLVANWQNFDPGSTGKDIRALYSLDNPLTVPATRPNPYPAAWVRRAPAGGARFFIADFLRTSADMSSDFCRNLLLRALEWTAGYASTAAAPPGAGAIKNPSFLRATATAGKLRIEVTEAGPYRLIVYAADGRAVWHAEGSGPARHDVRLRVPRGAYAIRLVAAGKSSIRSISMP